VKLELHNNRTTKTIRSTLVDINFRSIQEKKDESSCPIQCHGRRKKSLVSRTAASLQDPQIKQLNPTV